MRRQSSRRRGKLVEVSQLESRRMLATYAAQVVQDGSGGTGISGLEGGTTLSGLYVAGNLNYLNNLRSYVSGGPDDITTILDPLPGDDTTRAQSVNQDGDVVGISYNSADGAGSAHAVLWNPATGKATDLGPGVPVSISDDGQIVGTLDQHAVQFNSQSATPSANMTGSTGVSVHPSVVQIPDLGGSISQANDVNDHGVIVGTSTTTDDDSHRTAFIYDGANAIDLASKFISGEGTAINDDGWAVGQVNEIRAFVYHDGALQVLPPLGGLPRMQVDSAADINNRNEIVGTARFHDDSDGSDISRAALWLNGKAIDLNGLLSDKSITLFSALSISDRGQILAYGQQSDGSPATFLLTPERATLSPKGTLNVSGTTGDDVISVSYKNRKIRVTVNDVLQTFTGSKVKRLSVTAYDGDDRISLGAGVLAATIDAGAGDDTVSGGDGNDTILGGDGKDMLAGNRGDDSLNGGDGADTLNGGGGRDRSDNDAKDQRIAVEVLALGNSSAQGSGVTVQPVVHFVGG
ncbi:MAG TPA: DUF3466 family protein [Tepidisphaeraceae bacterium]|jgi:probable HAF family extracellular repeat protein